MPTDYRVIYPLEARKPAMGIITRRRLPHPTVMPRQPVAKQYRVVGNPEPAAVNHWANAVSRQHRRWDVQTGARIAQAEEMVKRPNVAFDDELDKFALIQAERHRRLKVMNKQPPPVVQRLLHPPLPPPMPLDPLDQFVEFMQNAGAEQKVQATERSPPRSRPVAPTQPFGKPTLLMPTKTGLFAPMRDY